ncbi:MAG: LPP20 family lipoprotein [Rikenellaceae bacterium]
MKKILLTLLVVLCAVSSAFAQSSKPYWIEGNAQNQLNFTGIASAKKTEDNYQQVAKERAYKAIASEIKFTISSESVLNTLDVNDNLSQTYAESITITTSENLEGVKLVETWQDDNEYWVFYELNRFDYEDYMQARLDKAIAEALDCWISGNSELQKGNMVAAAKLYTQGLTALEPVITEDLRTKYNGQTINLPVVLRSSLISLWDNVKLEVTPSTVSAQQMQAIAEPFIVSCHKNNAPIKDLSLTARFSSGDGKMSPLSQTNSNGTSQFYVTSVTGKGAVQQIEVAAVNPHQATKNSIGDILMRDIKMPTATVTINLGGSRTTALLVDKDMQLPTLLNSVQASLANNFCDIVGSVPEADLIMEISNEYSSGEVVKGDTFNTRAYYGTMVINIIDNRTNKTVASFNVNQARVLIPVKQSEAQGKSAVIQELTKRLNRDLPRILSQINIDWSLPRLNLYKVSADEIIPNSIPPVVAPEPEPTPQPKPQPNSKEIKGQVAPGVWVTYSHQEIINDKTYLHFTILNLSDDDYRLKYWNLNTSTISVYNDKGARVKVHGAEVGGAKFTGNSVDPLIIQEIPTEYIVVIDKVSSVSLFTLLDMKLRGLK